MAKKFLQPALFLMNRLSYSKKLLLMAIIFLLPLFLALQASIRTSYREINLIRQEQTGLDYLKGLKTLLILIPEHRGMANAYLHGESTFKEQILDKQDEIQLTLTSLDRIADSLIINHGLDRGGWVAMKKRWFNLQGGVFSPDCNAVDYFMSHSTLVSDLIEHMQFIGHQSGLYYDREEDIHYLVNIFLNQILWLAEYTGQARGLGTGAAAVGKTTLQEQEEFVILARFIQSNMNHVKYYLTTHKTKTKKPFDQDIQAITRLTEKFLDILHQEVINSQNITIDSMELFAIGTRAINADFALFDATVRNMDELLAERIVHKYRRMGIDTLFVVGGLLSVMYLFFGLYTSIIISINRLKAAAVNFAEGRLKSTVELESRDEMVLVASSFNEMAERLASNISLLTEREKELTKQLYIDPFTRLPNRFSLEEAITRMKVPMLILVNIDSFKEINNCYGNEVGDELIIAVGETLNDMAREKGFTTFKLAADEYALLIDNHYDRNSLPPVLRFLSFEISGTTFPVQGWDINVNVTMGHAASPQVAHTDLLSSADVALKTAKQKVIPFAFFEEVRHVRKEYENNIKWVKIIKNAIEENRVIPYFQPIISNHDGQVKKYESLIRIMDEENRPISPFHFLEVAKKSRLYPKLTRIMIDKSFSYFQGTDYDFSINLSVEDILNRETLEYIYNRLAESGLGPQLIFEIVESEGIENFAEVTEFIQYVKSLFGCRIAIDDFGTGYSNFDYILKLEVDYLKIDASLIKNIHQDTNCRAITETIVEFSRKIGIKTIAEFVHSEDVFEVEKAIGIDFSQGYYFGEPQMELIDR